MLNLIFAPSADVLVPLAESRIREAWVDPFDPPTIIVPNPAVGKWLTVRLAGAGAFGCVAGLGADRVVTLEKFLWRALMPDPGMVLVDGGRLAQAVCAALDEGVLGDDVYAPLRDYLCGKGGRQFAAPTSIIDNEQTIGGSQIVNNNRSIDPLKRVQLSAKIAQLFLEYEYNRPSFWDEEAGRWKHGADAQWLLNKDYFGGAPHEAWQKDLYRRVHESLAAPRYMSLPHLYRERREKRAKERRPWCDVGTNRQVILFGVSKISHFHRNTLVDISQAEGVDLHVFLTNPCAEFWEYVDTGRRSFTPKRQPRRRWRDDSPADQAGIEPVKPDEYEMSELYRFPDELVDHTLLKLWGGAGKENIFLWCQRAHWNFEYLCDLTGDDAVLTDDYAHPPTLLKAIQKSLLKCDNALDLNSVSPGDRSLQILACPDISREVEEVRELILDMVHGKKIGNFNDIAVYIPDPNKYLPQIRRVFGAYPQGHGEYIPYTILGASSGASVAARGLFALLDIISGGFNRALIFEFLRNPIVMANKNITSGEITLWERWAEKHGMFRGYDAGQRESMGDMGGAITDEHTFKRGIDRVITDIDDYLKECAKRFRALLEELNNLCAQFTKNIDNIDEAVDTLKNAVLSWLGTIPNDNSVNSGAEARVKREALGGLELIKLQRTLSGRTGITPDEFIALARNSIPAELAPSSSAWSGVTFAPLRASMALPHSAVFVMGLGATEFPGTSEKGSWDLLSHKRIVGDSDTVKDNRFAFLELMHAAKEYLILSYRARDLQKDELLQPSSVISELEEYLISQGLTCGGTVSYRSSVRREVPWVIRETLNAAPGRKHGTWNRIERELADIEKAIVMGTAGKSLHRHNLFTGQPSANKTKGGEPASTYGFELYCTDIRDLKIFFKNPLEYHLRKTLGLGYDDAVDMSAVNEPVESGYKLFALRKEIWKAVLKMVFTPDSGCGYDSCGDGILPPAMLDETVKEATRIYNEHVASGQAPEGHTCRMEREELINWAKKSAAAALRLSDDFPEHQLNEKDAIDIDCGGFKINGYHRLTLTPRDGKSSKIGILTFDKDGKPGDNHELWLEGLMLWIREIRSGKPHSISLAALNHDTADIRITDMKMDDYGKLSEIEEWLSGFLHQMLIEKRREHLPFTVIEKIIKQDKKDEAKGRGKDESFSECLQKLLIAGKDYNPYMSAFELTDANTRPLQLPDEELRKLAEFRYTPMLERWIHE